MRRREKQKVEGRKEKGKGSEYSRSKLARKIDRWNVRFSE